MKIVHFAPFAPNGCGLYEAARDMIVADRQRFHESCLVDSGATMNGEYINGQGKPGQEDNRGRTFITTESPEVARGADVLIAHTGLPDPWISVCQAPLIWILHGRPQACFRPEQFGGGNSFSLMAQIATWPRVKKMVTFWPYHVPFWKPIIPDNKLVCLPAPPIDGSRFSEDGLVHDFGALGGDINIVLADSMREDIDLYEITNGAIEAARQIHGVKFHFYGMEEPLRCWEYLIKELRILGALGEVWARRPNMQEIYRAADIILSPHRITTRVIAEALCCGTPVVAAKGCPHATWTCSPDEPNSVVSAIKKAIRELRKCGPAVRSASAQFSLNQYSLAMEEVFESARLS